MIAPYPLSHIRKNPLYGDLYADNLNKLYDSSDFANGKLADDLVKGCFQGIHEANYSLSEIYQISKKYGYGDYAIIRSIYPKEVAEKIISNIKVMRARRGNSWYLNYKKDKRITGLIDIKYAKIKNDIDSFFDVIKHYETSYTKERWQNAIIRHTNKVDEFNIRLRYNNSYRNGYYEFYFDFYNWKYEMTRIEGIGYCVVFYPKAMSGMDNKVVYILDYTYCGGFDLIKGFLVGNDFKKKNITSIKNKLNLNLTHCLIH